MRNRVRTSSKKPPKRLYVLSDRAGDVRSEGLGICQSKAQAVRSVLEGDCIALYERVMVLPAARKVRR